MADVSMERLVHLLDGTAGTVEELANLIRELDANPEANIPRLGEAAANLAEILIDVCRLRPDLTPPYLKPNWGEE
jgi:hypothetical protein